MSLTFRADWAYEAFFLKNGVCDSPLKRVKVVTDGVSCSIAIIHKDKAGTIVKQPKAKIDGGKQYIDELSSRECDTLAGKKIVGIDPNWVICFIAWIAISGSMLQVPMVSEPETILGGTRPASWSSQVSDLLKAVEQRRECVQQHMEGGQQCNWRLGKT